MTYLPMPTVDQLVQVFKDRNWTPTPVRGCWRSYVAHGDPEWFEKWLGNAPDCDIYERADELYGPYARHIYCGFDHNGCGTDNPWYTLGLGIRNALGVTKEDHVYQ